MALWPEHPGAVVIRAEAVAGDLQVGALSFEGLQGGSFTGSVTGDAGVATGSGKCHAGLHKVWFHSKVGG